MRSIGEDLTRGRTTARDVIAVRLSEAERAQVARAAVALELPLSTFLRHAALQASAVATGKANVRPAATRELGERAVAHEAPPQPEPRALVVLGLDEERIHYVDGEPLIFV